MYKRYDGNDFMKFEDEEQVAKYNGLVDKLNDDIDKLDKLKERLLEETRSDDIILSNALFKILEEMRSRNRSGCPDNIMLTEALFKNEEYKALWKSHSETYNEYMDMQEDAIIRAHEDCEKEGDEYDR